MNKEVDHWVISIAEEDGQSKFSLLDSEVDVATYDSLEELVEKTPELQGCVAVGAVDIAGKRGLTM